MLKTYLCWLAWGDPEDASTYYAETAGKARYAFLLDVSDCLPDLTFADIRSRSLGPAAGTPDPRLDHLAESYGLPSLPLGTPVTYCGGFCTVAGYREGYILLRDERTGETFPDHILTRKVYYLPDGRVLDGEVLARAIDDRWAAWNERRATA